MSNIDNQAFEVLLKKLDSMQKEITAIKSSKTEPNSKLKKADTKGHQKNKQTKNKFTSERPPLFKKALAPIVHHNDSKNSENEDIFNLGEDFGDKEDIQPKNEELKLKKLEQLQQQYPEIGVLKLTINFDV